MGDEEEAKEKDAICFFRALFFAKQGGKTERNEKTQLQLLLSFFSFQSAFSLSSEWCVDSLLDATSSFPLPPFPRDEQRATRATTRERERENSAQAKVIKTMFR